MSPKLIHVCNVCTVCMYVCMYLSAHSRVVNADPHASSSAAAAAAARCTAVQSLVAEGSTSKIQPGLALPASLCCTTLAPANSIEAQAAFHGTAEQSLATLCAFDHLGLSPNLLRFFCQDHGVMAMLALDVEAFCAP